MFFGTNELNEIRSEICRSLCIDLQNKQSSCMSEHRITRFAYIDNVGDVHLWTVGQRGFPKTTIRFSDPAPDNENFELRKEYPEIMELLNLKHKDRVNGGVFIYDKFSSHGNGNEKIQKWAFLPLAWLNPFCSYMSNYSFILKSEDNFLYGSTIPVIQRLHYETVFLSSNEHAYIGFEIKSVLNKWLMDTGWVDTMSFQERMLDADSLIIYQKSDIQCTVYSRMLGPCEMLRMEVEKDSLPTIFSITTPMLNLRNILMTKPTNDMVVITPNLRFKWNVYIESYPFNGFTFENNLIRYDNGSGKPSVTVDAIVFKKDTDVMTLESGLLTCHVDAEIISSFIKTCHVNSMFEGRLHDAIL